MTVFGKKQNRGDLAENLSELLLVMELADFDDDLPEWFSDDARRRQFQALRDVQEVEPIVGTGIESITTPGAGEEIIDPREIEVTPSDLDGPLYIATVERSPIDPDGWYFERFRSTPPTMFTTEDRKTPFPGIELVTIDAIVGVDIQYRPNRAFMLYESGRWKPTMQIGEDGEILSDPATGNQYLEILEPGDDSEESRQFFDAVDYHIKTALARQFARRYQWRVLFRDHPRGTASLSLVTDPKGAREAFKLRDKPKGAKRRPALKHWVRKHWRKNRGGDGASIVRAHLRGETQFVFDGMECVIVPSPYDIERITKR